MNDYSSDVFSSIYKKEIVSLANVNTLNDFKLLQIGWGYAKGMTTRTVDNFIVRFRKYFEDNPKNPSYFVSIRSIGYIFHADPGADTEK